MKKIILIIIVLMLIISGGVYYFASIKNSTENIEGNIVNTETITTESEDNKINQVEDNLEEQSNTSTCSTDELKCPSRFFALRTEDGCVCVNPDAQTRLMTDSRIDIEIPEGVEAEDIKEDNYTELKFILGQNYWEYLDNDGIVTTELEVSKGLERIDDSYGYKCNYSPKNEVRSQTVVTIDGQDFIKVTGSDYGMNRSSNNERYIQMLNSHQCRVITLRISTANPDAYNYDQETKNQIKENNITFNNILEEEKENIIDSISIPELAY